MFKYMRNLYSNVIGNGDRNLIVLHGFLGMGNNWKSHALNWAKSGFKVHLIDQRNHGRSFWNENFDYKVLSKDLFFYLESLKISKTIILGHSMGGKTAMQFALNYNDRVDKLIIVDISPREYPSKHKKILEGLYKLNLKKIETRKESDVFLSNYVKDFKMRRFLLKNLYWNSSNKLALRLNINVLINKSEAVAKEIYINKQITTSTLFLKGEFSDYISNDDIRLIETKFGSFKIQEISSSGHWLHVENPINFMDITSSFLKS
ncbi:MAG: alpha/beta hydrolase [Flavobacteriaceae bacterium]|nr:alpha/beta hydrolase [Flavobacteriaceae bacterium]